MRMIIDIEPGSTPIRGTVTVPGRDGAVAFEGWMALTGLLEALRSGGGGAGDVPARGAPTPGSGQGSGWDPDADGPSGADGGHVDHGEVDHGERS